MENIMDMDQQGTKKPIGEIIHFRKKFLRTEADIIEDAQNWMGEIDRRFLGLSKKAGNNVKIQNIVKQQDPAQFIDFVGGHEETRDNIFKMEHDKQEHYEQIQDKFLLAPKLNHSYELYFLHNIDNKPLCYQRL